MDRHIEVRLHLHTVILQSSPSPHLPINMYILMIIIEQFKYSNSINFMHTNNNPIGQHCNINSSICNSSWIVKLILVSFPHTIDWLVYINSIMKAKHSLPKPVCFLMSSTIWFKQLGYNNFFKIELFHITGNSMWKDVKIKPKKLRLQIVKQLSILNSAN